MVYTLIYRFFCICSNWTHFHTELTFLKRIFQKNGYHENFIDTCFKKFLNNIHLAKKNVPTMQKSVCSWSFHIYKKYLCKLELNY